MSKIRYYGLWSMTYLGAFWGFSSYIKVNGYSSIFGIVGFIILTAWYLWGCNFDDCKNG